MIEYPPEYREDYPYCYTVAHNCECAGKLSAEFRKARAMIPFQFIDIRAKDFQWDLYNCDITLQKKIINQFIVSFEKFEERGKGLYIYSKTKGSGKTMLACCILNELFEKNPMSTKFITALDLIELKKSTYEKNVNHKQELDDLRSLYDARLLVIDDLGVEMRDRKNEHNEQVLYHLINERLNNKKLTVITSNLIPSKLKTDERTIDRIEKMTITVNLPEVPVRMQLTEAENADFLKEVLGL